MRNIFFVVGYVKFLISDSMVFCWIEAYSISVFASVNDFGAFKIDAHIVKQITILKDKYFGECETIFLLSVMLNF